MLMGEVSDYQIGIAYRIRRILVSSRVVRDRMIAQGFVPGEEIKVVKRLYWGGYWVVKVHGRLVGLRRSELQLLQLYVE